MKNVIYEAFVNGQWVECKADELLFFLIPSGQCEAYRAIVPVEVKTTDNFSETKKVRK